MKIAVAAVPGAGKTTVLEYVKEKMPEIRIVNVGDLIFEIAKKKFGIKDRDDMRAKLTLDQERMLQEKAAEKISKMKDKIILIDTHMCIKTHSGYLPGMSDKAASIVKPSVVLVLEFDPKDIFERRKNDPERKRDIETEEAIEEHQTFTKQFALNIASKVEAAVEVINLREKQSKPFEHAIKASDEIVRIIKRNVK
jgi:adenylate kinase